MPRPPNLPAPGLGANIRAAREAKDMSQLALAHAVGWAGDDAGSQICRYESGQRQPTISTLVKIATALGIKLEKLLTSQKQLAD